MQAGEAIFTDTRSACHMRSGTGIEHMFPKLAGNVVATQDDPASLIRIVIAGGRAAHRRAADVARDALARLSS